MQIKRPIQVRKRLPGVYDPFLGTGTTLAAETTGRSCCGLELDPKYADDVVRPWQQLSGKQAVLDGTAHTSDQVARWRLKQAA
jgi:DNA modification methylase